jgi:pleiotropic regulator 1
MMAVRFTFASGGADNIKQWYLPHGKFIHNLSGHNDIVNAMAVSADGVLVSGAHNGSLNFWDYKTGHRFQEAETIAQPG